MLLARFPLDGRGTLYEQLARTLKRAILEGHFSPGERLPATRALADTLGLSRNTVLNAYEILRAEQLTSSSERSGTRVAKVTMPGVVTAPAPVPPQSRYAARLRTLGPSNALTPHQEGVRYHLYYASPPSGGDLMRSWSRKLASAARVAGPRYPEHMGFVPLRRAIAEYLARRRGVTCTEHEVLIVSGTQQAVTLAARVVLDEGDTVAIEDPHYEHPMRALIAHGARILSVRTDESGMVTSELSGHKPRLICVTPSHQFPSGSVMSLERRLDLLDFAGRQDSWILEDDYDSEFQYRGHPPAALRSLDFSGRVIYVGTFSKTLFPSLRLGFIVCPAGIRDDLCAAKRVDDLGNPSVEQAALAGFLSSRQFDKNLRKALGELERQRNTLLDSLRRFGRDRLDVRGTEMGVHVVAWLPHMTYAQLDRLIELGLTRGLGLYPIHPHYCEPPPHPGLLFGYAGSSTDTIVHVCRMFGQCLDEVEGMSARRRSPSSGTHTASEPGCGSS